MLLKSNVDNRYLDFLSHTDRQYYFDRPFFSDEERRRYFDLSDTESIYFRGLNSQESKLYYILMSGYFKATNIFFNPMSIDIPTDDIDFICNRFQLLATKGLVSQTTSAKHIENLCEVFATSPYLSSEHRHGLAASATELTKIHVKPMFLFAELIKNIHGLSLTMPSYREFQIIIGSARLCWLIKI